MPRPCWTGWDQSSGLLLGHLGPGGRGAGKKKASQSPSGWYKREQLRLEVGVSSASLGIATSLGRAGRSGSHSQFAGGRGCREAWGWQWARARATRRGANSSWLSALLSPPLGSPGGSPDTLTSWLLVVPESSGGVDSGSGGPGPRARLLGLQVAWGGQEAPEGEQSAEAAARETKPCACQGDWRRLCPPGMPAAEPTSRGASALGRQSWGSGSPSQGGLTSRQGTKSSSITHFWEAVFLGGPRAQAGLGRAGKGWPQAWDVFGSLE